VAVHWIKSVLHRWWFRSRRQGASTWRSLACRRRRHVIAPCHESETSSWFSTLNKNLSKNVTKFTTLISVDSCFLFCLKVFIIRPRLLLSSLVSYAVLCDIVWQLSSSPTGAPPVRYIFFGDPGQLNLSFFIQIVTVTTFFSFVSRTFNVTVTDIPKWIFHRQCGAILLMRMKWARKLT